MTDPRFAAAAREVRPPRRDLSGQRFGRLLVLRFSHRTSNGHSVWVCRCDCGATHTCVLSGGHTRSCGCLAAESSRATGKRCTKHGHRSDSYRYGSPEYRSWTGLRGRCLNPLNKQWSEYGGRGIGVCERWDSFENFLADMGPKPSPGHSIDRIDNDGSYEPSNCRWATRSQQQRNRRKRPVYEVLGLRGTQADLADHFGLPTRVVSGRIKWGWSIERAFLTKLPEDGRHPVTKLTNEKVSDIRARLRRGEKHGDIARQFAVTPGLISQIKRGKIWTAPEAQ